MIEIVILFVSGIFIGFGVTTVGLAMMFRAAKREGYRTVIHRPVPADPRESQLERLRYAGEVLGWALKTAPLGYRVGPGGRQ